MAVYRFTNGDLALPDGSLRREDLYVDTLAGIIISGQEYFYASRRSVDRVIDLHGGILAPGFIDAQINGAYGVDFSCFEEGEAKYLADLDEVAERIVETGTTAFVPTIITQRKELYPKLLPLLSPRSSGAAHVLGYHAEGPFLYPEKKGAHEEQFLLDAPNGIDTWEDVYSAQALDQDGVKIITAAPDVLGVLSCVAPATQRGVVFSVGHSNASVELATEAIEKGATFVTHLFNAMPQLHHRNPGVVGTLGARAQSQRPYYGVIADGIHVHPSAVRLAYDCHPDGAILVTDAMSMMNPRLPDGRHEWRDGRFITKEGLRLYIDGTSTLAGSAISLDHCVRNLADFASVPLSMAIRAATWNVAQMLGGNVAKRKGALLPGRDADLVVLDRQGFVQTLLHQRENPMQGSSFATSSSSKKRPKRPEDAEKKSKACHPCRRAKLRCVIEKPGEPCARCRSRDEASLCKFKIPLHDEEWQEGISATMDYVVRSLNTISQHLNIVLEPPPTVASARDAGCDARDLSPSETTSLRIQLGPEHDWTTQSGAEELLAQSYARLSPSLLSPTTMTAASLFAAPSPSIKEGKLSRTNFFGLLDDLAANASPLANGPQASVMAEQLQSTNLDAVGSQDPRSDVVKSGTVSCGDAEVLVAFFHAHLAPHFFGFPLKLKAWPYLSAGKGTITPLILGAICLVAAERIPRYHDLADRLAKSSLSESILGARPGLAFARSSDPAPAGGDELLDLELGIGPEEISALLIYASLSCSPSSHIIAQTAFEWTRGYLRTFMLPCPPPVTLGEVFGLLPARRDLTYDNWLRLWLLAFIIDAQQCLHHERKPTLFDPHYFCDTLLSSTLGTATQTEQQNVLELVAHARLCAIIQRIQHARLSPAWKELSTENVVADYEGWTAEIDRWWQDQRIETPSQSATFSLTLFKYFAKVYLNLGASLEERLSEDPSRWRFSAAAVRASFDMLRAVRDEPYASWLNLLLPFYVKMVTLSGVVLLDSLRNSVFVLLPCSAPEAIALTSRLVDTFSCAPTPAHHASQIARSTLMRAIEKAEMELP